MQTLLPRHHLIPRSARRAARAVALGTVLAALLLAVGWLPSSQSRPGHRAPAARAATGLPDDPDTGPTRSTAANLAFWQERLRADPRNYVAATVLGGAWAQRARETGDVGDYGRAEEALRGALATNPRYPAARAALAGVLFAEHQFTAALQLADAVVAAEPGASQAYAVAADARLELGQVQPAESAYRRLVAQSPGPAVYARLARVAFLRGDVDGARSWFTRAVDGCADAMAPPETSAWYRVQLADLELTVGRLAEAEAGYRAALEQYPGYYLAVAGLARVAAARGDLATAETDYRRAVAVVPRPDLLAALGDVLAARGDTAGAAAQYRTVRYIGTLAALARQVYNRQLAIFYADHRQDTAAALDLARSELATRTDVYGWDALAWTAYQAGRYPLADQAARKALALGTPDPKLLYHAGMAALGVGDRARARELLTRALALNPAFDLLQAPLAQAALRGLR
jgi:tetratricopeptide (TPR) repeat protein